ncbi:MAG: 4-hydroxy-tetrahydrodipicolinate reductase [Eubacteriales bacterium]|nr:4-hydroxy-tetrahydrodipicolinate reductase [Eubacteriales bacterium]
MTCHLFLNGCNGRMGRTIREIASGRDDIRIAAGSDLAADPTAPFPIYTDPAACRDPFDVLVDFSSPAALPRLFNLIEQRACPSVICTTGLDQELRERLQQLSAAAPVFVSANMSLGVNLLIDLARQAAKLLYPGFDIEIIEAHHNQKVDAPSGTALMIADQLNQALDGALHPVTDRSQVRQKRQAGELGIHAVRGGTIVGEHTVLFAGPEETIEIRHSAQSRAIFARGALAAALFLAGKPAGMYSMADIVAEQRR